MNETTTDVVPVRDAATGTNAAEAGVPEIADLIRRSLVAAR